MIPYRYLLLLFALYVAGCAHVVSKEARELVSEGVSEAALFKNPESFKGETVMLGGIIISVKTAEDETRVEVLQQPLDYRGRPERTDRSLGRFIVVHEGYLDSAIYREGRGVTVVGEVLGETRLPVEGAEYRYVLIKSCEIKLIKPDRGPRIHFGFGVFHSF